MIALPDLSRISSVVGLDSATSDEVIAGLSTGSMLRPSASASALSDLVSGRTYGPATRVDLSDHAKAVLAQAESDQAIADRLADQIHAGKDGSVGRRETRAATSSQPSIFDQIHDLGRELVQPDPRADLTVVIGASLEVLAGIPIWQQAGSADNLAILRAGAKLYNKAQAMQDLAANGGQFASPTEGHVVSDDVLFVFTAHEQIASAITDLQRRGLTDKAQALAGALENGTLMFQKAADVPDLNMTSWMLHFGDTGEMGSTSLKPTGSVKAALENGDALALGMADRGNFYVTW